MKKVFLVTAAALAAITLFAGCSQNVPNVPSAVSSAASDTESETVSKTADGNYDYNLDGFVQYMTDKGFISGDAVDTTASAIGAEKGKRFTMTSGTSRYFVELYEYSDANLNDTAQKTIANAKKDGSFELFGSSSGMENTTAAVTDDGRFLMLYTDSSTNADNTAKKDEAIKAVGNFGK